MTFAVTTGAKCNQVLHHVTAELASVTAPTLLVAGEKDLPTPPSMSEVIRDHVSGAQLEVVSGIGHFIPLFRPDRLLLLEIGSLDHQLNGGFRRHVSAGLGGRRAGLFGRGRQP